MQVLARNLHFLQIDLKFYYKLQHIHYPLFDKYEI